MKLKNNQQGLAHVGLIILVVVVLAAIGVGVWRIMANKKSPTASSTTTSSSTGVVKTSAIETACLATYHDAALCKFQAVEAANPIDKTAYKAVLTVSQNGTNSTLTFEQDGKGNTSLMTSGGGTSLNTIQYGGNLYVQNGSVWIKYPSGSTPTQTSTDPNSSLSFVDSLKTTKFTKVGTVSCDGGTCLKYKIVDSTTPDTTEYGWFDTSDYKLRGFSASSASTGTMTMTISYPSVNISAPSPVQNLSQ